MSVHVLAVNPEPWTSPSIARRGATKGVVVYKNEQLRTYQLAVKELLGDRVPEFPAGTRLSLTFYFWRNTTKGQPADATNMQKATEDAIQDVLLDNDRHVVHVESWIMEQGTDVEGRVVIGLEAAGSPPELRLEARVDTPLRIKHDYRDADGVF